MYDTDAEACSESDVYATVAEAARMAGFAAVGDGVTLWERRLADGTVLRLSCRGGVGEPTWSSGRYGPDGGAVVVTDLPFARALAKADRIPTPVRACGNHMDDEFATLEVALIACGLWVPLK